MVLPSSESPEQLPAQRRYATAEWLFSAIVALFARGRARTMLGARARGATREELFSSGRAREPCRPSTFATITAASAGVRFSPPDARTLD